MADKIKLTYFNFRGLGEPIRFILGYVGADFEDVRVNMNEWPKLKKTLPYKQLPTLEIDGKTLNQSTAICRYLGQKYGLEPQDKWTNYQLEAVVDHVRDIHKRFSDFIDCGTPETKKEFLDKATSVFSVLDPLAVDGYFYGKKVTWVDVLFSGFIDNFNTHVPGVLEPYPNLVALVKRVKGKESLSKYLKNRPEMGIFNAKEYLTAKALM